MDIRQYVCPECLVSDLKVILYPLGFDSEDNFIDKALFGIGCSRCGFVQNFFLSDVQEEKEFLEAGWPNHD